MGIWVLCQGTMALDLLNVFYCLFETFNKILGKANIGLGATLEDMRQAFEAAEPNETHMLLFSSHQSIKFAMGHILIPLHTHPCKKVACNHCPTCQSSCTRWKNGAIYTIGVSTSCYGMTFQIYLVNNPVRCVETFSQGFVHGDRCHHAADRHLGLDCELCSGALCMCLLFTHTQAFIGYVVIAIFIYNTIYQDISYSGNRLMVQEAPPLSCRLVGLEPLSSHMGLPIYLLAEYNRNTKGNTENSRSQPRHFLIPSDLFKWGGGSNIRPNVWFWCRWGRWI